MKRYNYKAKDKSGKTVTGEVEAASEALAVKLIREKGLVVLSLTPQFKGLSFLFGGIKNKVPKGDIALITRQLATMVSAGLPITESLLVLRNQAKGMTQKVVGQVLADVESGESLSKACAKHPKVFSPTYLALLESGEAGGVIDKVLVRLADNLEKDQEFKSKVKGAMIYPVIILIAMAGVIFIMMVFVLPKMMSLYAEFGADLPLPTKILMGFSGFMVKFWPLMTLLVLGLGYGFGMFRKTPQGRKKIDEWLLKLPIAGELQRQVILTELTRTLALMTSAGVSILEGLNITAGVVGNKVMSDAIKDVAIQVEKGFPIAYSFARHPDAFPYLLSQMMAVGEETGKTDEILQKLSHIFEVESNEKVKALTASIEPLVMVILGVGVAFLVIAVIMPIYNLTSSF